MSIIYINNRFVSEDVPCIYANDRGLLLGDGIFETLKVKKNCILFFDQHFTRLVYSANYLNINFNLNSVKLKNICTDLIERNNLQEEQNVFLRITVTRGRSKRGIAIPKEITNTLLITTGISNSRHANKPLNLTVSSTVQNEKSPLVYLKTLQFLPNILVREEAIKNGFDDGIMLNTQKNITETSAATIFFVQNNCCITSKIDDGVMNGIMRNIIIQICQVNKISYQERSIHINEIISFESAFVCNSLVEIQPVASINMKKMNQDNTTMHQITLLYDKFCNSYILNNQLEEINK